MTDFPVRADGLPVLRRRDLIEAGYTDAEIRHAVDAGDWERIGRGGVCRRVASEFSDPHAITLNRYIRGVMARALGVPTCIVSHLSAAAIHGLPADCAPLDTIHVTRPGSSGSRRTAGFWQHAADVTDDEVVAVGPLRVTSMARTLIDVGRSQALRDAAVMADFALNRRLVTAGELAGAVLNARYRPGAAAARRAMARADGRSESVGETSLRLVIIERGLPAPELQVEVYSERGEFLGRCDLGYPKFAVLIEFDGMQKYRGLLRPGESPADAVIREKLREEALVAAGFVVVRITWADLHRPQQVADRIRAALERGARNLAAGLVTGICAPREALRVAC